MSRVPSRFGERPPVDVSNTAAMLAEAARRESGGDRESSAHGTAVRSGRNSTSVDTVGAQAVSPSPFDDGTRRVTLPWSMTCSDNRKYAPALWGKPPKQRAVLVLTKEYRQATERARAHVAKQLEGLPPLEGRLRIVCTMYEPTAAHPRDVSNVAKQTQDILNTLAYRDDGQIDDARWVRGAVDIDAPRIEIVVTQLLTVTP